MDHLIKLDLLSKRMKLKVPRINDTADANAETQHLIQIILGVQEIAQNIEEDFMLPDGTLDIKTLRPNDTVFEMITNNKTLLEAKIEDIVNLKAKTDPKLWQNAKQFTENLLETCKTLETKYNEGG